MSDNERTLIEVEHLNFRGHHFNGLLSDDELRARIIKLARLRDMLMRADTKRQRFIEGYVRSLHQGVVIK